MKQFVKLLKFENMGNVVNFDKAKAEMIKKIEFQAKRVEFEKIGCKQVASNGWSNDYKNGAAKNIRIALKHFFPKVKFSVVKERGVDGVRITYKDGPRDIENITNLFDCSDFEPMVDYYGTKQTPFTNYFGGFKYVQIDRDFSDNVREKIKQAIFDLAGKKEVYTSADVYELENHFNIEIYLGAYYHNEASLDLLLHQLLMKLDYPETIA